MDNTIGRSIVLDLKAHFGCLFFRKGVEGRNTFLMNRFKSRVYFPCAIKPPGLNI